MSGKLACSVLAAAALIGIALYTSNALATPASGFMGTTIAAGRFSEIQIFNHEVVHRNPEAISRKRKASNLWLSIQKTQGPSDLYVQNNVWAPGGSTGWHTHPGHSLIIVTSGAVTAYDGDDRSCTPTVYTEGAGFVDPGGDHVHNLRNEGQVEARTIAVQLIPADAVRRIDMPPPGNCSF
jgi:quercetin dioxygenase-like cupin family protein